MTPTQSFSMLLDDYITPYVDMRIEGFRMLRGAGLRIPEPIYIVTEEAFNAYMTEGFTKALILEIENAARAILRSNKGKGVAVRRAFFIQGVTSPPGPRSAAIFSPKKVSSFVEKIFSFARDELSEYLNSNSHFACILHPFINPRARKGEAGCDAYLYEMKGDCWAVIRAVYGNDEGAVVLPQFADSYLVNLTRDQIWSKELKTHQRGLTLTAEGAKETKLPNHLVHRQVLSDDQILSVSRMLRKSCNKLGDHIRLEFSVTEEGIFFTECAKYTESEMPMIQVKTDAPLLVDFKEVGTIVKVSTACEPDVTTLCKARVIFMPNMSRDRMIAVTLKIAKYVQSGTMILFPGSLTSHHIVRLREFIERERKSVHIMSTRGQTVRVSGDEILIEYSGQRSLLTFHKSVEGKWKPFQTISLGTT